jgi:ABC-type multidrug transport system fused ATPase/permease subunit
MTTETWHGVAAEDVEEVDHRTGLKLQKRSRRLLGQLLRPHLGKAVLTMLVVIAEHVVSLAGPLVIAVAIDTGIPNLVHGNGSVLAWCVAGYMVSAVGGAGLRYVFLRMAGRIGQDVVYELRQRIFRHSQRLSLSFHESYTSGKVISRMTSDVDAINTLFEDGMEDMLAAMLPVFSIAVIMLVLDLKLAALVMIGFVPLILVTRWFYRLSQHTYRGTSAAIARVIVHFVESMNGIRAVQAFRREGRNESIMDELNGTYRNAYAKAFRSVAVYVMAIRLVGNLSLAAVLAYGAWRVVHGELEIGVLTAFTLYLRRFYDPLDDLAMFANTYSSASASLEKVSGLLEEEPDVNDPARPRPLPAGTGAGRAITFERVSFRYSTETPVVLPEFDLTIPAGQTVALVGPTGAGKSTIAKLVARFYDPSSGAVALDGVDLRDLTDEELRREVVMVTQESFLFAGSVADNIGLGKPDASREAIERAARAVEAGGFIESLPDGYDTDVRKRGGRLSAGQRQLVAFARAFLADPAVLVLDEATSSMDVPTERAVQAALESVLADRTALIIAHRLSTVLIADRVLVIDDGRVVEDGLPAELIESGTGGRFAALHSTWLDSLA